MTLSLGIVLGFAASVALMVLRKPAKRHAQCPYCGMWRHDLAQHIRVIHPHRVWY